MIRRLFLAALVAAAAAGCVHPTVNVAPVKVEPIQMTIDVNLHNAGDIHSPAPLSPKN
jgi:hypothetical protein